MRWISEILIQLLFEVLFKPVFGRLGSFTMESLTFGRVKMDWQSGVESFFSSLIGFAVFFFSLGVVVELVRR